MDGRSASGAGKRKKRRSVIPGIFPAERIMKHKHKRGQLYYLVKWLGWPSRYNTWEPETNILDPQLVVEYRFRTQKSHSDGCRDDATTKCCVEDDAEVYYGATSDPDEPFDRFPEAKSPSGSISPPVLELSPAAAAPIGDDCRSGFGAGDDATAVAAAGCDVAISESVRLGCGDRFCGTQSLQSLAAAAPVVATPEQAVDVVTDAAADPAAMECTTQESLIDCERQGQPPQRSAAAAVTSAAAEQPWRPWQRVIRTQITCRDVPIMIIESDVRAGFFRERT